MAIALVVPNSSIPVAGDSSASASASGSSPAAILAPGFRFHPTDEELVSYYLKRKLLRRPLRFDAIAEVDLYKWEPTDLPGLSRLRSRDQQWYFFSPVDRRHTGRAARVNRVTPAGYWKTTGKDRPIVRRGGPDSAVVGMKKTLVFHSGRAPRGRRTNWVMHEYRLEDEELARSGIAQDTYVLCRIFQKGGAGPQNGAQYGAPYDEHLWEEGDELLPGKVGEEQGALGVEDQHGLQENFVQNQDLGFQHETAPVLVRSDDQKVENHAEEPPIFLEDFLVHQDSFNGLGDYFATSNPQDASNLNNNKGETNTVAEQSQPPSQVNELMQVNYFAGFMNANIASLDHVSFEIQGEYDGIKLQDDPKFCINMGETTVVARQSQQPTEPPSQAGTFSGVNLLADTVNVNQPSTQGYATFPGVTCNDHKSDNAVNGSSNLPEMYDGMDFLDTTDGYTVGEFFDLLEPNQMLLTDHNDTNMHQNSKPGDCTAGWMAENCPVFVGAPNSNLLLGNSGQIDMLDQPVTKSYGSKIPGDVLGYFQATDRLLADVAFSPPERKDSNSSTWETPCEDLAANVGNEIRAVDASAVDVQSSGKNEDTTITTDVRENEAQHRPVTNRLVNMLSSFSPPPAFAAEFPTSALKAIGENFKNYSTQVNVTAEIIQISGLTVRENAKFWSLQQKEDKEYLLSYDTKANNVTKSGSCKAATKMHDRVVSSVLRGAFYLFCLSALFLTASFKMGICMCTR